MRVIAAAALILLAACSQQAGAPTASRSPMPEAPTASKSPSPTPSAAPTSTPVPEATCRLPVWWSEAVPSPPGSNVHAAFVSVPDGAVSDVGILPPLLPASVTGLATVQSYGGTYDQASQTWYRADSQLLSPDRTRYAYWSADPSHDEIHVVDIATGGDRVIYKGTTFYFVIAFESDGIYAVHAINIRQGAFEKLYRLDPQSGAVTLVPGSDRPMYQWGWVLISAGAAWGIGARAQGSGFVYSVLRLDLTTAEVTQWLEAPDDLFWPLGTDSKHRLYVDDQQLLWRLPSPGQVDRLANPGPVYPSEGPGATTGFVSDSLGAWFSGQGGVWLYSDSGQPKQFAVGPPSTEVFPAGPCL